MKIQTTRIYSEIDGAIKKGYTTISAQGSSRSSKTYNICIFLCVFLLTHPKIVLTVVRSTLPAIKGSVLRDFKEILQRMGVYKDGMLNKTELILTFPNGSFIEFISTDSEQKLRGRKRHILYVNEANEIDFLSWQQLKMRTTMFSIIDYNPSFTEGHWICSVNNEEKTYHFISTYKDNPFLEQTIIDEIESLQWKNRSLWQVYGLGQMAVIEGLVFPTVKYVDEIPSYCKDKKRYLGMDFGYSLDPTSIVDVSLYNDTLWIDEVCYETNMKSGDIIRKLNEHQENENRRFDIISESADPRLVDEIFAAGLNIYSVHKYAGSIHAGIMKMQELKICVTKRSANIKKEFSNYVFKQDKEGNFLNEPIDAYNHAIDAIRYVVLEKILGGKRKGLSAAQIASIVP